MTSQHLVYDTCSRDQSLINVFSVLLVCLDSELNKIKIFKLNNRNMLMSSVIKQLVKYITSW